MPSTTRINLQPGNQIPEHQETQTRDRIAPVLQSAAPDDVDAAAQPISAQGFAAALAVACRAPEAGLGVLRARSAPIAFAEAPSSAQEPQGPVSDVDRPLVDALAFFDAPEAELQLPFEQMIYSAVDEIYALRAFPNLPVIPCSPEKRWQAVQMNLTHDSALGAALVVAAHDPDLFSGLIGAADKPGQFQVRLKLASRGGQVLDVLTIVDARVHTTDSGRIIGAGKAAQDAPLWPLLVAKAVGKLLGVLRASGHLPAYGAGTPLTYTQFHSFLTGHTPKVLEDVHGPLLALAQKRGRALVLQTPVGTLAPQSLPSSGSLTPALGGMAHRLRHNDGLTDVLLLAGHHYGVVACKPRKSVTLYNPLGFNPHPSVATAADQSFFDPHSLSQAKKADATIELPLPWLEALGCRWFL